MSTHKAPATGVQAAVRSLDDIGVRGTQALLARKIGVTRSAVQGWDRKRIPLGRLPKLVEITGLSPAVLRADYREAYRRELGLEADEVFRNGKAKRAK